MIGDRVHDISHLPAHPAIRCRVDQVCSGLMLMASLQNKGGCGAKFGRQACWRGYLMKFVRTTPLGKNGKFVHLLQLVEKEDNTKKYK